jgi:hypothetical protein
VTTLRVTIEVDTDTDRFAVWKAELNAWVEVERESLVGAIEGDGRRKLLVELTGDEGVERHLVFGEWYRDPATPDADVRKAALARLGDAHRALMRFVREAQ